jgi:hypothetical protein
MSGRWDEALIEIMKSLDRAIFQRCGNKVMNGPFAGMQIPPVPIWNDGNTSHKLLGCYERELHASIEKAIERNPRTIINVGSAEGYYAIGMARRLPGAVVHALDNDERSLALLALYATRNKVTIWTSEGCKDAEQLCAVTDSTKHCLYISDCEGAELALFDPERCPRLRTSDLIIECHNFINPDCSAVLQARFSGTHDIEVIKDQPPELHANLLDQPFIIQVLYATDIRAAGSCWLACWAREKAV